MLRQVSVPSDHRVPDITAVGDVYCSCGEFVFACVLADEVGNQCICPNCGNILETMETE